MDRRMDRHRPAMSGPIASRWARGSMLAVPLLFLGLFFVYPVLTILGRGLWPGGDLDLSPLGEVLGDPSMRDIAWFSVWQAALSTLLTLAIGLPAAYALTRFRFR